MKVKLSCTYYNEKKEKKGIPGDFLESPKDASVDELRRLLNGGSAELVEPPRKSERE